MAGCGWYAVHWSFANLDLVIVVTYFKCGEGLQGATGLLTFVTGSQKPVIILGDFNITPEKFMTTTVSSIIRSKWLPLGKIRAPQDESWIGH